MCEQAQLGEHVADRDVDLVRLRGCNSQPQLHRVNPTMWLGLIQSHLLLKN
jgi:hypothetical protein